ncbi:GntR family transcriptional regulator, partial [Campylobacter ureolyticus]|uniref:GntR family transcriptional regulator n=1 Tax=Campylobacter ureolyticus TaxID=827 RepID=UPI00290DB13E
MLTYNLVKNSKKPLYFQLYENIKNDILNLKTKDKLPSKRSLANHLNISVITVENAYNQLIMEGFIYSVPKKGYYANKGIQKQIKLVIKKQIFNKNSKFLKEKKLLNLSFSTNNEPSFPLSTWKKLLRE